MERYIISPFFIFFDEKINKIELFKNFHLVSEQPPRGWGGGPPQGWKVWIYTNFNKI